ncbi:MAG: hypothetical protein SGILL_004381 [Bacillariaceae sp.]
MQGNDILWNIILSNSSNARTCKIWDVTVHPPVDITSWPLEEFPDLTGAKSKTLHSAGWFPSGTLLIIPSDTTPNQYSGSNSYEDTQYNRHEDIQQQQQQQQQQTTTKVEFEDPALRSGNAKPLPSQVMASVTSRFENDAEMKDDDDETKKSKALKQQQQKLMQKQRLKDRTAKLDARIARLEEEQSDNGKAAKKNKKVSDQVLYMLVKSRATGDTSLKMMDRIYFQCMVVVEEDDDDHNSSSSRSSSSMIKEYRYFSPQDTFAKIAGTFVGKDGMFCEVLCRQRAARASDADQQPQEEVYRRFPPTMRIYEAVTGKYLTDSTQNQSSNKADTLVVRWYKDQEDATPSILEDKEEGNGGDEAGQDMDLAIHATATAITFTSQEVSSTCNQNKSQTDMSIDGIDDGEEFEDTALTQAIEAIDNVDGKGKKKTKKASTAMMKVKQMKIKSKAKGDAKRIKVEQRFFLEVVVISGQSAATCGCYFLAKTDPIERILQYCSETKGSTSPEEWEFLVPADREGYFLPIKTTSMTTQEAEEQNLLLCFGSLILRRPKP